MSVLYVKEDGQWKPIVTIKGDKGDPGDPGTAEVVQYTGTMNEGYILFEANDTPIEFKDKSNYILVLDYEGTTIDNDTRVVIEDEIPIRTLNNHSTDCTVATIAPSMVEDNGKYQWIINCYYNATDGALIVPGTVSNPAGYINKVLNILTPEEMMDVLTTGEYFGVKIENGQIVMSSGGAGYSSGLWKYVVNQDNSTEWVQVGGGAGLEIGDIGIAPLGIDESLGKRRYLNGSTIIQDQYPVFTERVKTAIQTYAGLGCTEEEWQTISTMSVGGQCGKFVVDDTAGTIRLPKIIMPIQGLTDLTKLGEIVEAGLPNITGKLNGLANKAGDEVYTGAFNVDSIEYRRAGGDANTGGKTSFDASRSNPIYGNSDTVQQEQIQYPYFIQVATGSSVQENITNKIELNNPFVLLEGKYFETPVYNASWLQSNAAFTGSLALHPTAYNALLVEQNPNVEIGTTVDNYTKRGLSVKLNTEDYTDYDFVLNVDDQTFRCPLKINQASSRAIVGNGMTLGLTNGTTNFGISCNYTPTGSSTIITGSNGYGSSIGSSTTGLSTGSGVVNTSFGVTTDPTKSGIETSDDNVYLYFYIGETMQNANLVNVGRIQEQMLTRGNKEEITSWGMPDYSKGISAPVLPFTAPCDGVFCCSPQVANFAIQMYVNGHQLFYSYSGPSQYVSRDITILLSKGDVLTWSANGAGATNQANIFFPLKGVN